MLKIKLTDIFLYIGLIFIPFLVVTGHDTRYPKEMATLLILCVMSFLFLKEGLLKNIANNWIFILFGYMVCCLIFLPNTGLSIGVAKQNTFMIVDKFDINSLWNIKPVFYALVYLLFFIGMVNSDLNVTRILKIMSWVAFIMSVYIFFQKFNIEQFFSLKSVEEIGTVPNANLIGTLGQPTIVSSFICFILPIQLILKRWLFFAVSVIAILFTGSDVSIFVSLIGTILYFLCKSKKIFISFLIVSIAVACLLVYFHKVEDSGRISTWKTLFFDITKKDDKTKGIANSLTGFGPGAFSYFFYLVHSVPWRQAHNEYFEFLYNYGFIGLLLFLTTLYSMMRDFFKLFYDETNRALLISFVMICLCAGGTFVWQLPVHMFYTVVIISILYNRKMAPAYANNT